jgi:hypothetical protein
MDSKIKTPSYTKRAIDAYKQRCKEINIEKYNARNNEYNAKSRQKKQENSTEEQLNEKREANKKYMKVYNAKVKQQKQILNQINFPDITLS